MSGDGSIGGNSHDTFVSIDMLMSTVKALVEHFDSKISELTVSHNAFLTSINSSVSP